MPDLYDEGRRERMMQAVEHCIIIWESVRDQSMEAYKASNALKVMVDKLKTHQERQRSMPGYAPATQQTQPQTAARPGGGFGMFPNGNVNVTDTDDLPPEQSAAMTLGMLSSGGLSPGPGFGMNNLSQMGSQPEKQSYPAGMAALLNDPMSERTGLTPQYSGPETSGMNASGMNGAVSPLSQMLNQGNNFMGMDGMGADIDWVSTFPTRTEVEGIH